MNDLIMILCSEFSTRNLFLSFPMMYFTLYVFHNLSVHWELEEDSFDILPIGCYCLD